MEGTHCGNGSLALSRRKQILDEQRVERFVMVLLDQGCLNIRTELAGLLLKLVD